MYYYLNRELAQQKMLNRVAQNFLCIYLCVLSLNHNFSNCEAQLTSAFNLTSKL